MTSSNQSPFQDHVEIIPDRLYWVTSEDEPKQLTYFNIDNRIRYIKYHKDFGPVSLAGIVNFCRVVHKQVVQLEQHPQKNPLYFHSSTHPEKRANAGLLISCYQLLVQNKQPSEIWQNINGPSILPFRDASYNQKCPYKCNILDCLLALQRSIKLGWFCFESFSIPEFEALENHSTGNMSIIVPSKIIACRGPQDKSSSIAQNDETNEPTAAESKCLRVSSTNFISKLKNLSKVRDNNQATIVRCNSPDEYERTVFTEAGLNHFDLLFPDGSCPTIEIIHQFTKIVDEAKGYVVVHCKAGLGRTGTLIACYMMKQYEIPARQVIAWIRLCRSGCILGKQQLFLEKYEEFLIRKGYYNSKKNLLQSQENQACIKITNNNPLKKSTIDKENMNTASDNNSKGKDASSSSSSTTSLLINSCINIFRRQKQVKPSEPHQPILNAVDESIDIKPNHDSSNLFDQKIFFTEVPKQADKLLQPSSKNEINTKKE